MYEVSDDGVKWKGKTLKNVSPDGFDILTPIVARQGATLYVLGKPTRIDAAAFNVLSDSYARDADTIYLIMDTKLKPIKAADASSFAARGDNHGVDAQNAWFRDRRMRLPKGTPPTKLRSLGHVYATDGAFLYFTNDKLTAPDGIDLTSPSLRLRWFDDNEINMPQIILTDGTAVWASLRHGSERWAQLDKADFDTVEPVPTRPRETWRVPYLRDVRTVWYRGTPVPGADPKPVTIHADDLLTDGERLWHQARPMAETVDQVAFVDRYTQRGDSRLGGVVLHHGDTLVFHDEDGQTQTLASAQPATDCPALTDILREIYTTTCTIFARYPAPVASASRAFDAMAKDTTPPPDVPAFTAHLSQDGALCLDLSCGTRLTQPATCWYTLACHLWAHMSGRDPAFLPYPPLGTMLPRSTDMHTALIARHRDAFFALISHLFDAGHTDAAQTLAHFALGLVRRRMELEETDFQPLANLPRDLIPERHYRPAHHQFEVTTNLAVSRLIVNDGWLATPDIRDRIDVLSTLHGALLSTNKTALFFKEIIPAIQSRYEAEPNGAVREQLAMVLEAALIKGQVDCEVNREMHHAAMLPVIEFCIAHGLNTVFNRARLAETLWALDRDTEADAAAEALIAEIGEDAHLSGVYCNRLIYRTPRLWFLRGKVDISWRSGPGIDVHKARLAALKAEFDALLGRYGKDSADWDEMQDIRGDIDRYATGIANA